MLAMRASPAVRRAQGPFVLPARLLLLFASLLAIALGAFNLAHELHAGEVDIIYTVVAGAAVLLWLVSLLLVYKGVRVGAFIAGTIAFIEFGVIVSAHFVSGPAALSAFARHEGLQLASALMGLLPACLLGVMAAIVSWSHPTGYRRRLESLPLLIVGFAGAVLVVLAATDAINRSDLGGANPEDAAFIAAITSAAWLAGALWIARVRRTGAIVIAVGTFNIWYSFITIHLTKGATSVSEIGAKSGTIWAVISVAAPVLAAASFLVALGLLVVPMVRRKPGAVQVGTQPARRGA